MDNVYKQRWDFTGRPWKARMYGDQLRWYVMRGPDLRDLRADYLELTGRPPVPPRKAFGLWVSEFGYDNFGQIDALLTGLRSRDLPVDGFVLDLNWFGGVVNKQNQPKTHMGRLDWDEDQAPDLDRNPYSFRNPGPRIQSYAVDHIGLTVRRSPTCWASGPACIRFLDDPRIALDNNATEQALRGMVVGRKNHYGSRSKRGTEVAALFYSVIESAKLCGVEPKAYLLHATRAALTRPGTAPLPLALLNA